MSEKPKALSTILGVGAVFIALAVAGYLLYTSPAGPFAKSPGMANDDKSLPFPARIKRIASALSWKERDQGRKLSREILLKSLEGGRSFLLANQKPEGNFNYQYDFVKKTFDKSDNQVRQAGALWGIALLNRFSPDKAATDALLRGLEFFSRIEREAPGGAKYFAYPGERDCSTGAVALVALSIIEAFRTEKIALSPEQRARLEDRLNGYLKFLVSQQLANGRFSMNFNLTRKARGGGTSPYFDGETLLALCKAARTLSREDLLPVIQKAARSMAEEYTVTAWEKKKDSDRTKGFYQWGSMAFREYAEAGFKDAELYEDTALALAWWMIHTHKTLSSGRNSAYAHEGLVSAYAIAKHKENATALRDIDYVNDRGLYKLTGWQVGGPLAEKNGFLRSRPTTDRLALGGVMNRRDDAPLRIDVTQHQMHAVILSLENIYF